MKKNRMRPSNSCLIGSGLFLSLGLVIILVGVIYLYQFTDDTKPRIFQAYLHDLDGDGDLDAFLVYLNELNRIVLNDGSGRFTPASGLMMHSYALAFDDIDGDGDLEAIINNFEGQETGLLCAETPPGYSLNTPAINASGPGLATLDDNGDGLPESFLAGCCNGTTVIYNYGTFSNPSACLSTERTNAVALTDLNASGAPDAFLAKGRVETDSGRMQRNTPNQVWFNDGGGNFTDSGQRLGQAESLAVVTGDLNGDGAPDVVVGNRGPDEVWMNDGSGTFSNPGQRLGSSPTHSLFLVDLDADGDLDIFAAGESSGRIWLNDGSGQFLKGQRISYGRGNAIALGDLSGDGAVDLFEAGVESYRIWHGSGDGNFAAEQPVQYQE